MSNTSDIIPIYNRNDIYSFTNKTWLSKVITRWRFKRLHNALIGTQYNNDRAIYRVFKRCGIYISELEVYGLPEDDDRLIFQYWSSSHYSIYVDSQRIIYNIERG